MSKDSHRIKIVLIIFLALISLIFALGSIVLWMTNYDHLTSLLLEAVHKEDWRPYFEERVFPPNRFSSLQYLALICLLYTSPSPRD